MIATSFNSWSPNSCPLSSFRPQGARWLPRVSTRGRQTPAHFLPFARRARDGCHEFQLVVAKLLPTFFLSPAGRAMVATSFNSWSPNSCPLSSFRPQGARWLPGDSSPGIGHPPFFIRHSSFFISIRSPPHLLMAPLLPAAQSGRGDSSPGSELLKSQISALKSALSYSLRPGAQSLSVKSQIPLAVPPPLA
jgi:hypothetical protein